MPITTSVASISKNGLQGNSPYVDPTTYYNYYSSFMTNLGDLNGGKRTFVQKNTLYQIMRSTNTNIDSYTAPLNQAIVKIDDTGNVTPVITDVPQDYPLNRMVVDSSGNYHLLFDNTPTNASPQQFILRKYDSSGTLVTSKSFTNSTATNRGINNAIGFEIDSSDNMYVYNKTGHFTKINSSYNIVNNLYYGSFGTSCKLIGFNNGIGYIMIPFNGPQVRIMALSSTGTVLWNKTYSGVVTLNDGVLLGSWLYLIADNGQLMRVATSTGNVGYGYSFSTGGEYITATSYGNLLIAGAIGTPSSAVIFPVNPNSPTTFIGYPVEYTFSSSPYYDSFNNGILSTTNNCYLTGRLLQNVGTTTATNTFLKLPMYGNLSIASTGISYTLKGFNYSGTLSSTVLPSPTITGLAITATSAIVTPTTPTSATGTPTISTSSVTVYNYNQQIV